MSVGDPTYGRVLCVDVGTVRMGVALSDVERMVATPTETIDGRDHQAAIARIDALVQEHEVCTVVVGLPLELDGSEGRAVKRTRRWVERLEARLGMQVVWVDERLTSAQAERSLFAQDMGRSRRKKVVDQVAAALILQSWLDQQRSS